MDLQIYPDRWGEEDLLPACQAGVGPNGLARFENVSSWAGAIIGMINSQTRYPAG